VEKRTYLATRGNLRKIPRFAKSAETAETESRRFLGEKQGEYKTSFNGYNGA